LSSSQRLALAAECENLFANEIIGSECEVDKPSSIAFGSEPDSCMRHLGRTVSPLSRVLGIAEYFSIGNVENRGFSSSATADTMPGITVSIMCSTLEDRR
jgi:hypothetical protein